MIAAVVNQGLNRILARPEIKTPADLRGKKIGVTRIGAISHSVLLMMLKRWNMSPTDLQVLQLGSSPNMLAGLDKGGIDAAVMTIPFVFVAEDRGFRVLVDLSETDIYYLHTMIASTRSYIRANHDKVSNFLKGFLEGIAYFKHNKKESLEIVRKKLRLNADQERNLERSYDLLAAKYYEPPRRATRTRPRRRTRCIRAASGARCTGATTPAPIAGRHWLPVGLLCVTMLRSGSPQWHGI